MNIYMFFAVDTMNIVSVIMEVWSPQSPHENHPSTRDIRGGKQAIQLLN